MLVFRYRHNAGPISWGKLSCSVMVGGYRQPMGMIPGATSSRRQNFRPPHLPSVIISNQHITNLFLSPVNGLYVSLLRGQGVPYTFYNNPPTNLSVEVAERWQKYIMGFLLDSNPNLLKPEANIVKYGKRQR